MARKTRIIQKYPNKNSGDLTPAIMPGKTNIASLGRNHLFYNQIKNLCNGGVGRVPMPAFSSNTRNLDRWMLNALSEEKTGFLNSFIDQASMIHSGRSYQMVGPSDLVEQTLLMFHSCDGGDGFRSMMKKTAINYYCSNFGAVIYLNRLYPSKVEYDITDDDWLWDLAPVTQMFSTDSTAFAQNYDYVYPYTYNGEPWPRFDYIRIVSMPSTQLETWDIGRCALFRCIHIARLTSALYEHVFDLVSPDSTKGIITIFGMTTDEFLEAVGGSEAENEKDVTSKNSREYQEGHLLANTDIGDILILADNDREIKVKFVTLGRIPEGFFIDSWTKQTLQAFASNLGYSLSEFIDSSSSNLVGQSGAEVTTNAQRGSTKGGNEFISQLTEKLRLAIPRTVHFEFSERDPSEELVDVEILAKKTKILVDLFEATQQNIVIKDPNAGGQQDTLFEAKARGQHILDRDEARRYGIELGVLPAWLETNRPLSDVTVTDDYSDLSHLRIKRLREEFRERPAIKNLAQNPLGKPVILYENSRDRRTGFVTEKTTTLWDSDNELRRPTLWSLNPTSRFTDGRNRPVFSWKSLERATDDVLKNDHTVAIRGILRRGLLSQAKSGESIASILGNAGVSDLTTRFYTIARDGAISIGRELTENQSSNVAADINTYVKRRINYLIRGGASENGTSIFDPRLEDSIDVETNSIIKNTREKYTNKEEFDVAIEDIMLSRSSFIADHEALRMFSYGVYIAGKTIGAKRKEWIASTAGEPRDLHEQNYSVIVDYDDAFPSNETWSQELPGCQCSIRVLLD